MFKIDRETNSIQALTSRSFAELGFKERANLQEWIARQPSCLGEELLIIQKEFSGSADTNERLDLLALDKQSSLVLIENKLDDTGRDVTWQAANYASYCASLSKENVRRIYQEFLDKSSRGVDAKGIAEFLDAEDYEEVTVNKGFTRRIILIAAKFSQVSYLNGSLASEFGLRVQCFSCHAIFNGRGTLLNIDQIIPTKDVEEFMIGLADKALDEIEAVTEENVRHRVRRDFWAELLQAMAGKSSLFQNISPGSHCWIGAGSGIGGVPFNFVAGSTCGRAEL
jgi:hypothetical protein